MINPEKLGASGLIMAILGGALITLLQGKSIDVFGGKEDMGAAAAKSFVVPVVCFTVAAAYALYARLTEPADPVVS